MKRTETRKMTEFKTKQPDEVLDLVPKASGALLLLMKAHFEKVEVNGENKVDQILECINSRMLTLVFENMLTMADDQKSIKKEVEGMKKKLKKGGRSDSCETLIDKNAFEALINANNTDEEVGDEEVVEEELTDGAKKSPIKEEGAKASPASVKQKSKAIFSQKALADA